MGRRKIIVLTICLLIITAGCTNHVGKGYIALDTVYKEADENPDDILNKQNEKTVIYTNVAGRLSDEHKKGMYCKLKGSESSQAMNVYFENEDMYESFTKKKQIGDDVDITVRIYRDDKGDLYAVFAE